MLVQQNCLGNGSGVVEVGMVEWWWCDSLREEWGIGQVADGTGALLRGAISSDSS